MSIISEGRIFLSDNRELMENKHIRRYSTFNNNYFLNTEKEHVTNFHTLYDDLLAPNTSFNFNAQAQGFVVIIPVTGTVIYLNKQEYEIEVDNALLFFAEQDQAITLKNPYHDEIISYLIILIKSEKPQTYEPSFLKVDISKPNLLANITPKSAPFNIKIGLLQGREEAEYVLNETSVCFAFVLAGAFEIDGRLLHERDGIALWNTKKIEIEALSNNAIIITIELPL